MVFWELTLAGFLVGLYWLYLVHNATRKASGNLKKALVLFFLTDASYISYMTLASVLGHYGVQTTSEWWYFVILIHLVPGATWLWSNYTWLELSRKAGGNGNGL